MEIKINLKKKKISDVNIGDAIYCYDEFNDNFCVSNVSNLFTPTIKKEYQEKLKIKNEVLYTSSIHPFYDAKNKKWIESQEIDDIFGMGMDGNGVSIINEHSYTSNSDRTFYDFTVDGYHNYFVGKNSTFVLTHNSATTFFPVWHQEIEDIIVLKNNKGTEDNRVRNLDYAVQLSKIFYERFIKNEEITLFSPHNVPGLYDVWGMPGFDELYVKYENDPNIPKKKVKAQELIIDILKERAETGRIYLMNIDHCNSHGPFKDQVVMSNLCVSGDTKIKIRYPMSVGDEYDIWDWQVYEEEIKIEDLEDYIIMRDCQMSYDKVIDDDPCEHVPQIEVLSYNIETNQKEWKPITSYAETSPKAKVMRITDEETGKSIVVTPDHKVYTLNRGYVMAKEIMSIDILCIDNKILTPNHKLKIEHLEEEIPVYDITVEGNHNFFANGILIHNCMEILLKTTPFSHIDEANEAIALCILSCVNVGVIKSDKELEECCDLSVRFLDELIDHQQYPVLAAELTTRASRSLGIGYIGLAHYLAKLGLKYSDPESWKAVHKLSESFQYYLLKASNNLAREKGPCDNFKTTKYSDGILPIDTYKKELDEICQVDYKHDWEELRQNILEHGLRHTTLSAQPPTESCLFWEHKIKTSNGFMNFHQIAEYGKVDWKDIEFYDKIGWYDLENSIQVQTQEGYKTVDKLYFNGNKEIGSITLENGNVIKCTTNHRFLIKQKDGSTIWKRVYELNEEDDIVEF